MPRRKSAPTDAALRELRAFGLAYPGAHTKSPWPGHLDLAVTNWCLQSQSESEFVTELLSDQAFIPKYFTHDVALNKQGAPPFAESIASVQIKLQITADEFIHRFEPNTIIIDSRPQDQFKTAHLKNLRTI